MKIHSIKKIIPVILTLLVILSIPIAGTADESYFYASSDNSWATVGNWFSDYDHATPLGSLPNAIDDVIFLSNITALGGDRTINTLSSDTVSSEYFGGSVLTVTNGAFFNDFSYNSGTIVGDATFNEFSYNSGIITRNATFNELSRSSGTISGDATFNDSSYNFGTITGDVTFNESSGNSGTISGDTTFNTNWYSSGGAVPSGGKLIVNGSRSWFGSVSGTLY